jgi:class 3 adenylate cyclase
MDAVAGGGEAGDRLEIIEVVQTTPVRRVSKAYDRDLRQVVSVTAELLQGRDPDALLTQLRPFVGLARSGALSPLLDVYQEDDRIVLVSPWIEGVDLLALLVASGTPGLPVTAVLAWLDQVGEAVRHLQARGLMHGDIRPANLILNSEQRIVVVGLGTGILEPPSTSSVHPDVRGLAATAAALLTGSSPTVGAISGTSAVSGAALQRALLPALDSHGEHDVGVEQLLTTLRHELNAALPTGVVTFLLTDIVGSTRRWETDESSMAAQLARHDLLMAEAVEAAGGRLLKARGEGDATFSVFTRASAGIIAALAAQVRLRAETELVVRMAVHTGEAELREADYFGRTVNRAARLRSIAPDGGIVVSTATADLVIDALPPGASLVDRGEITLKDLDRPEHVYEVASEQLTGVVPITAVTPSPPAPTAAPTPTAAPPPPTPRPSQPVSAPPTDLPPAVAPASRTRSGPGRRLVLGLVGAAVVAVIAIVLVTSGGGGDKDDPAAKTGTDTSATSATTGATTQRRLDEVLLQPGDLPTTLTQRSVITFGDEPEACGQRSVDQRVPPVDSAAFAAQDPNGTATVSQGLRRYVDEGTAEQAVLLIEEGFSCAEVSITNSTGQTVKGAVGPAVELTGVDARVATFRTLTFGDFAVGLAIVQQDEFTLVIQFGSFATTGDSLQEQVTGLTRTALGRLTD